MHGSKLCSLSGACYFRVYLIFLIFKVVETSVCFSNKLLVTDIICAKIILLTVKKIIKQRDLNSQYG